MEYPDRCSMATTYSLKVFNADGVSTCRVWFFGAEGDDEAKRKSKRVSHPVLDRTREEAGVKPGLARLRSNWNGRNWISKKATPPRGRVAEGPPAACLRMELWEVAQGHRENL